jgi:LPXTG-motif cell wall-anchored protein
VWASVIGLTLLYLTAGYFIGGYWADRMPTPVRFYQIVAWGALLSGLIPFAARPALPLIAGLGLSVGLASALAMLILFAIPMTLLGCVSPFAIRLALESVEQAGQTAGRLYAVSTLGSVIGSLAPVLLLLPEAGTQATFLMVSGILLSVALVGLALARKQQTVTHR